MATAVDIAEIVIAKEQIRAFHMSGHGLEMFRQDGALTPAILSQVPELRPIEEEYPLTMKRTGAELMVKPARVSSPADGISVQFDAEALPLLHAAIVATTRHAARAKFEQAIVEHRDRLRGMLVSGEPEAGAAEHLSNSLGLEASSFFDTSSMAAALSRKTKGTRALEPARKVRIEQALSSLEQYLVEARPAFWLFHAGAEPSRVNLAGGRCVSCAEVLTEAMRFCRVQLERLGAVVKAIRVSRLEQESAYQPEVHDAVLARIDWQSATAEEIAALPAVIALETAETLAYHSLTDLGKILRSGFPIQILVADGGIWREDLSGIAADFGYLAMAHREVFVLQGTLAKPMTLLEGLQTMAKTFRPAVAVVAVPQRSGWQAESMLVLSRLFPLYQYNPENGPSWAQRFVLRSDLTRESVTPVHACALFPALNGHFRVIPKSAWDGDQLEIGEYLVAAKAGPVRAVPYIWVTDAQGQQQRAVFTRELVNLCLDRLHAWHTLEELAGIRNSHVESAVAKVRQEMEQLALDREQTAASKARSEGARNAVHNLVAILTSSQPLSSRTAGANSSPVVAGVPASPATVSAPSAAAAPAKATASAPAAEAMDPYIDSFLCTSCNDCMKVNPRLFLYDANKQAYLADPKVGTFEELVRAAEGCPAKCIHPGTPRPDDSTASPAVRTRAAKLG